MEGYIDRQIGRYAAVQIESGACCACVFEYV